jgi:diguanylate cyclase (GGDEF)-like protein
VVVAATGAFLVSAVLSDQTPMVLRMVATAVLSAVALFLVVLPASRTGWLCVCTPLIGVTAIVVIDLATYDATVTGQVFFSLPVLYAATQLRPAGAMLVMVSALAGETVVVFSLLPPGQAVADLLHVGTTLVLTAAVLTRAGAIHDRLVTQLRQQAAIDPLTGLVTRRVLDEATRSAMTGAETHVGTSLVIVDVDRFKAVNDTYGHVVGDDVLAHIAGLLAGSSRVQDVVARMGGDEFAVLMPGCGYPAAARRANDFIALVRDTPLTLPDGSAVALSVSAGVANGPERGGRPRTLYASADAALYAAKHGGRGRVGPAR